VQDVWHEQGLPADVTIHNMEQHFGIETYSFFPVSISMHPGYESKVLEDLGEHLILQGGDGVIYEQSKVPQTIPRYLKFPIETREDWEKFKKERMDPDTPGRIPDDIDVRIEALNKRDIPLGTPHISLYGWLRNLMGVENVSMAIMDDPAWVEEMIAHSADLTIAILSKFIDRVEFDFAVWWEDMCYKSGPLVSPRWFKQAMIPHYKRIVEFFAKHGVTHHQLDCDGNIHELAGLWLEAGIDIMFPLEAAHTNQVVLRREFGKDMRFMGGVDKIQLIKGREAIDDEIERLKPLVADGGYIPHVDHRCPPDVTLDNYRYYLEKKREMIGRI